MTTLQTEPTPAHNELELADMIGPLAYWGPAGQAPTAPQPIERRSLRHGSFDRDALIALASTLHGRTWSGTHALMSALLEPALPFPHER